MEAKKSLGQNFLIDNNIINLIADSISASSLDLIIEIGPGQGALTKELVKKNSLYRAYEIDKDMQDYLKVYENERQKIIYEDFLKANLRDDLKNLNYNNLFIVGNLPYYITSPIIEKIIDEDLSFEKLVIMVQKEVANRFMANPGTKEYGYFTLFLKYYFDINRICEVSKDKFRPIPKVDSTVLELTIRKKNLDIDIKIYQEFLKKCFSQKRKTLKNNLKEYDWYKIKNILDKHNLSESIRAEELSEDILSEILKALYN